MQTKIFGNFRLAIIACSTEEEDEHLRQFVASFIKKSSRVYYQQALIEHRTALNTAWEEIEQNLDTQYCCLVTDADGFLQNPARSTLGIYFDRKEGPYKITALDAGIFFSRKGYALGCERFSLEMDNRSVSIASDKFLPD